MLPLVVAVVEETVKTALAIHKRVMGARELLMQVLEIFSPTRRQISVLAVLSVAVVEVDKMMQVVLPALVVQAVVARQLAELALELREPQIREEVAVVQGKTALVAREARVLSLSNIPQQSLRTQEAMQRIPLEHLRLLCLLQVGH
jgi:hypothetical protein